ncbi:hypothetical protein J6590_028525 [Homalodisca vitripennis]|nr:hypothetical protein J6590_028525 [Homalodisca vitripennis]
MTDVLNANTRCRFHPYWYVGYGLIVAYRDFLPNQELPSAVPSPGDNCQFFITVLDNTTDPAGSYFSSTPVVFGRIEKFTVVKTVLSYFLLDVIPGS